MKTKSSQKSKILWSAMLRIEDIQPRKSRWGTIYAVFYTSAGLTVCATEKQAQSICLFEPYEMKGQVKTYDGGFYLKLDRMDLFDPVSFKETFV